MGFDFEVIQHISAKVDRQVRFIDIPALKAALGEARAIIASGHKWRAHKQSVLMSRLSAVSRTIEQVAVIETALKECTDITDAVALDNLRAALRDIDDQCRDLESQALLLASRGCDVYS